ncbi:MAG: hypothetical protein H6719_25560 [Sandaracinaceae bacterium]|nr:hypothetical protein [Sandaracinaceae bacterium]
MRRRRCLGAWALALAAVACEAPPSPPSSPDPPRAAATLQTGLLVATSVTAPDDDTPVGARLERLRLVDGAWVREPLDDPESQVFHHVRAFDPPGPLPLSIVTLGGGAAAVKLWRPGEGGALEATEIWRAGLDSPRSRVRDAEVGALYGDAPAPGGLVGDVLVVGTHDEGVVAVLSPRADGTFAATELDRRPSTFVHEIEIGDVDGDGTLEVYASISSPNSLVPGVDQPGSVVRYVPARGEGPELVVDLGRRHAKELLVDDVDGDGRDELYVVVEARTTGAADALVIAEPVEIRRFDADGPADGALVATLDDRMTRFLVAGDLDGDGQRELVAATFSSGLYRLDPPREDPGGAWTVSLLDADSRGFEHATLLADLDADGADELYVADDASGELRRYVAGRSREVIRRVAPGSVITWSLAPCPGSLTP